MNDGNPVRVRRSRLDVLLATLVLAGLMGLYVWTLLPGLGGTEDTPKFQYIGAALGTAHEPGYPLYVLLSFGASKLPFGTLAWRINLMSACWGSLTAALVFLALRRLSVHRWLAVSVALGLGLGQTFWQHAVFAEVYTLSTALMAATLLSLLEWDATKHPGWLYASVGCASLSFGDHLLVVGAIPALVLFVLMTLGRRLRLSTVLVCSLIVAAGIAQYGYIWIRTVQQSPYLEARAHSVGDLWHVLRARQFDNVAFRESPSVVLLQRLPIVVAEARNELGTLASVASVAGAIVLLWRQTGLGLLLTLAVVGQATLLAMLGSVAVGPILLPALVPAWLLAGVAFEDVLRRASRWVPSRVAVCTVGIVAASVPAMHAVSNFSSNDHRRDTYDTYYFRALFAGLPDRAAFLTEHYTVDHLLRYQQFVTDARTVRIGVRPDLPDIEAMTRGGDHVFAFSEARSRLWSRAVLEGVTVSGLTLAERFSSLPDGRVVVMAGSAPTWPDAPLLGLGSRGRLHGRAIVVAVQGRGIATVTPEGFEGDISFTQGEPLGRTGLTARVSFRAVVSRAGAAVFIDGEAVGETNTGIAVVEIGTRLEAAYTLRLAQGMRAPVEMRRRPLYRVVSLLPPGACTPMGNGHWSVLSDPGREGVLQGRVEHRGSAVARWQVYLASRTPLAVSVAETLGPGTPAVRVDHFDPRAADANVLRDRLRSDGLEHANVLLNAPSVTRVEVTINDEAPISAFRLGLGGVPTTGFGRGLSDQPMVSGVEACGVPVERLALDAETRETSLYLGPGGDRFFGNGWTRSTPMHFGFERGLSASPAEVLIPLQEPRALVVNLRLLGEHEDDEIEAEVNGHPLGWRPVGRVWTEVGWQAPTDVWMAGVNVLVLRTRSAHATGRADEMKRQAAPLLTVRRIRLRAAG